MLGDFNTVENSSIYRFLTGGQSLGRMSSDWIDLGEVHAYRTKSKVEATLDFENNPRWDNQNLIDIPRRFDWIMLKEPYPKKCPKLIEYTVIGKERRDNITPSDHYGITCDIDFEM